MKEKIKENWQIISIILVMILIFIIVVHYGLGWLKNNKEIMNLIFTGIVALFAIFNYFSWRESKRLADAQFKPSIDVKIVSSPFGNNINRFGTRFALLNYSNFTVFFRIKINLSIEGSEKSYYPLGKRELPVSPAIGGPMGRLTAPTNFLSESLKSYGGFEKAEGKAIKATVLFSYSTFFEPKPSEWREANKYTFGLKAREWNDNWSVSERAFLHYLFPKDVPLV